MIRVRSAEPSAASAARLALLANDFAATALTPTQFWTQRRAQLGDVATELLAVFNRKCAYCESKPEPVSFSNIDHYLPKTLFPQAMFEWTNLLVCCHRCNTYKRDTVDPLLLSPIADHPEMSIGFKGSAVIWSDERGERTVGYLRLDRPDLDVARREQLTLLMSLATLCERETLPQHEREILLEFVVAGLRTDAPYTSAARHQFGVPPAIDCRAYEECSRDAFDVLVRLQPQ